MRKILATGRRSLIHVVVGDRVRPLAQLPILQVGSRTFFPSSGLVLFFFTVSATGLMLPVLDYQRSWPTGQTTGAMGAPEKL